MFLSLIPWWLVQMVAYGRVHEAGPICTCSTYSSNTWINGVMFSFFRHLFTRTVNTQNPQTSALSMHLVPVYIGLHCISISRNSTKHGGRFHAHETCVWNALKTLHQWYSLLLVLLLFWLLNLATCSIWIYNIGLYMHGPVDAFVHFSNCTCCTSCTCYTYCTCIFPV